MSCDIRPCACPSSRRLQQWCGLDGDVRVLHACAPRGPESHAFEVEVLRPGHAEQLDAHAAVRGDVAGTCHHERNIEVLVVHPHFDGVIRQDGHKLVGLAHTSHRDVQACVTRLPGGLDRRHQEVPVDLCLCRATALFFFH